VTTGSGPGRHLLCRARQLTATRLAGHRRAGRARRHLQAPRTLTARPPGSTAAALSTSRRPVDEGAGHDGSENRASRTHDRPAASQARLPAFLRRRHRCPASASLSASSPSPVRADTGSTGAFSRKDRQPVPRRRCEPDRSSPARWRRSWSGRRGRPAPATAGQISKWLARLRHDRLVGGHHQQHRVEAADSREHVLHETFVAGHVDERHAEPRASSARSRGRW